MTEELEQLLKNLKLHRMQAVYDEQLRAGRRVRWNGVSAARCCRNAGRWKRFRMPSNRA